MNKIFMTCLKRNVDGNEATLAVFLKGNKENADDLMGFLKNQHIDVTRMPEIEKKSVSEFAYFDEGFKINIHTHRWSFYELRSYINTYTNTWEEDSLLRETMSKELRTCDESKAFDDKFFVELSRKIDHCEDLYYQESSSIALFMNGILKIINENLDLNWAAAKLKDIRKDELNYLCYVPTTIIRKDIINSFDCDKKTTIVKPIEFCGEHLADIVVCPSPYSPKNTVINKFLDFLIMHIDDFVYGDLKHKRRIFKLEAEIARLKNKQINIRPTVEERKEDVKKKLRLIVLGASEVNNDVILSLCRKAGFDKNRIDLHTDYDKLQHFDTNNLLLIRTHYDGIVIGPMPHSIKGNLNLIQTMKAEPQNYPPHVIVCDKDQHLKFSKNTVKAALNELIKKIHSIDDYAVN